MGERWCIVNGMTRPYTLKRRAEQQAATRQRIVEAAVDLHGDVGPARTSLSMVADRAGVQRNTLYAHFPDERSLLMACSALALERDPLPDASAWHAIDDPQERLRAGLGALYGWYARNAALAGCVLRDAEIHPLTREITMLRMGPSMEACEAVLGAEFDPVQRALLRVALGYATWRTLVRDSGLATEEAIGALIAGIGAARKAHADPRKTKTRRPVHA